MDHLAWVPSLFIQFATDKSWLFASAAEGFFVISGMLVGYIYGPRFLIAIKPTISRIWKRAFLLYILSVSFTLFYAIWHHITPTYERLGDVPQHLGNLIASTVTLQYSYGWADFLSRYAVFMLFAPLVLWIVVKGRWYLAAAISSVLWIVAQFTQQQLAFSAWQLLFVFGIIIGYYLPAIELFVSKLSGNKKKYITVGIPLLGLVSYLFVIVWLYSIQFAHRISPPNLLWFFSDMNVAYVSIEHLLQRDSLAIGRLLVGTLWFCALFITVRQYEAAIDKVTRGYITLLGKNSLFVYSLHAFVIYLIDSLITPPAQRNIFINTLFGVVLVGVLIGVTLLKQRLTRYNRKQQL